MIPILVAALLFLHFLSCNLFMAMDPINSPLPRLVTSSATLRNISSGKKPISIMASVNYAGQLFPVQALCTKSMQLALDRISTIPGLLSGYELTVEPYDDLCSRPDTVRKAIEHMNDVTTVTNRMPIGLGPECSGHLYTGIMLRQYNFVGMTSMTTVPDLQLERRKYAGYFNLGAAPTIAYLGLVEFIRKIGWRKVAVLSEIAPYWNTLENQMTGELEKRNMTMRGVFKVPFVSGIPADENQIRIAVEDLLSVEPRIILINSNTPVRVACWLHRYGLYGPSYVFFLQAVLAFMPNDPTKYAWCTEDMLNKVMPSFFFFGDSAKSDIFGQSAGPDASGLTSAKFTEGVQAFISDKIDSSAYWPYWGMICYEQTFFAAFWLNATETLLNARNETLSDWVTSSWQFQQRGSVMYDTMNQALYSFKVNGLRADYEYDPVTQDNTKGFSPVGFFQIRKSATASIGFAKVPVAYYKVSNIASPLTMGPEKIVWLTTDGKPPADSIQIVPTAVPLIPEATFDVLVALASIIIFACLALLFLQFWSRSTKSEKVRNSLPGINDIMLFGDVILASHTFCLPGGIVSQVDKNCSAMFALIIIGGSLILSTLWLKIELGSLVIVKLQKAHSCACSRSKTKAKAKTSATSSHQHQNASASVSRRSGQGISPVQFFNFLKAGLTGLLVFEVAIVVLCTIWLAVDPLVTVIENGPLQPSSSDKSLVLQLFKYTCKMPENSSASSLGSIAVIAILIIGILLRIVFLSFVHKSAVCPWISDFGLIRVSVHLESVLIFSGCILVVIFWSDSTQLHRVVTSVVLLVASLNIATIFLPKVIRRDGYFLKPTIRHHANYDTTIEFTSTNTVQIN